MQPRDQSSSAALTRLSLAAVVTATLLSACGSDEKPQTVAPAPVVKREKAPEDPTAKMAHAVTIGKSTVGLDMKYDIQSKPIVGNPIEIEIALVPTVGADSMTVTLAGSTGLTLSTDTAPNVDKVTVGQIDHVTFSAQANEAAVFYVTVTATVFTAGTSSVRNFALPVIVSNPAAPEAAGGSATAAPAKKS